ncbi:MAG TPA: ferritin-like domain-containing protein [Pirellulaceae bacterium]|nr:ferritin-like domain-containing protein [Pirellulaceae bacterium]
MYRFERVATSAPSVNAFGEAAPQSVVRFKLLRQEPPMSLRDEVIFLLQTAAEIEHALLVQYLYARYSLDGMPGVLGQNWREKVVDIAKEEMAHLLSMQNLLRALGGPLNFEREDHPFNSFYPFPFRLEPLTVNSLARYVLAEMPDPSVIPSGIGFDLDELKQAAGVTSADTTINRVGALFDLLGDLVKQLDPTDFRSATVDYQGTRGEWLAGADVPRMLLEVVTDISGARALVKQIGEQGEGPGDAGDGDSHFRQFLALYSEAKTGTPRLPYKNLAVNPSVDKEGAQGTSYIANDLARALAALFNTRYRILLAMMQHALLRTRVAAPPADDPRKTLVRWAIEEEMGELTRLAKELFVPLTVPGDTTLCGPPFELPYSLNLPDQETDRWRHHLQLIEESTLRIAEARRLGSTSTRLPALESIDSLRKPFIEAQIRSGTSET